MAETAKIDRCRYYMSETTKLDFILNPVYQHHQLSHFTILSCGFYIYLTMLKLYLSDAHFYCPCWEFSHRKWGLLSQREPSFGRVSLQLIVLFLVLDRGFRQQLCQRYRRHWRLCLCR